MASKMNHIIQTSKGTCEQELHQFQAVAEEETSSTRHLTEAFEPEPKDCETFLNITEKALLGIGMP
jgi:hypothetical protein